MESRLGKRVKEGARNNGNRKGKPRGDRRGRARGDRARDDRAKRDRVGTSRDRRAPRFATAIVSDQSNDESNSWYTRTTNSAHKPPKFRDSQLHRRVRFSRRRRREIQPRRRREIQPRRRRDSVQCSRGRRR